MKRIRNDLILIAVLLTVAVLIWVWIYFSSPKENMRVYIYYKDELLEMAELKPREISYELEEGTVTIVVEDDGVLMKESSCPDHICVHQGKIKRSGQTITCLPNRIYIVLKGDVDISS